MLGTNQEDRDRFRAEDRKACLLERKKRLRDGVRCSSNAKIILQVEHVRDFSNVSGIVRVQSGCVIR